VHREQAIIAATQRINVMTEKPMATRWKDGERMVKACDENK
jgi:UDP-N-acetyl-2-amino-2-deoxyglucuronate dehydrogenase